ncbi:Uncharacterised protein [Yersinia intermedia]|nr:Uncharacterised protein [Yersinia intermedia]
MSKNRELYIYHTSLVWLFLYLDACSGHYSYLFPSYTQSILPIPKRSFCSSDTLPLTIFTFYNRQNFKR